MLEASDSDSLDYELYRSACVKEFELILEQSGKLLRKHIKPYFATSKEADKLAFKDIFRHAALHSVITVEESERWMLYRDNRNTVAHDYGEGFANETIALLPQFIIDAKALSSLIEKASE